MFLDESGVNINMARRYGRSVGKKRVVDSAPFSTPKSTTVVSAIRLDGQFACTAYEGGTTKGRFIAYVRDTLLPSIRKGDYVVMDNLRAHHCKEVGGLIQSKGAYPVYLPPYSPDLNPIEQMWSKMKSKLRAMRVRIKDDLVQAVQDALSSVTISDCKGWFCHSGYCN